MKSAPKPKTPDPHDDAVAVLARDLEEKEHADEKFAKGDKQVKLEQVATRPPLEEQKRPNPGDTSSRGKLALRGLIGLLFVGFAFVVIFFWQSPYGYLVNLMVARLASQHASTSLLPPGKQELPLQPSPSSADVARAGALLPQQSPFAQTTPQGPATTALQTMARNLEKTEQSIQELKASEDQMARDNAELVRQLKAAQTQMVRDSAELVEQLRAQQAQLAQLMAKASERNLRPKTSTPPTSTPSSRSATAATTNRAVAPVARPGAQPQSPTQLIPKQQ